MSKKKVSILICLVTTSSLREAQKLASGLIQKHLAACVNIISPINSLFLWNQKVTQAKEALMIIKTTKKCFRELQKFVQSNHSYEVPEIVSFKIEKASRSYLDWVQKCLD